jgi:hypothetical protein
MGERDKPRCLGHACRQRTSQSGQPCISSSIRNASRNVGTCACSRSGRRARTTRRRHRTRANK